MTARRRAFTLVEVLVALSVLVFIAMLGWSTVEGTFQARDWLERSDAVDKAALVALDRLEREFSLAFLTSHKDAVNTYRTVFVGRDGGETDTAWFATTSHRRRYAGAHECDQTEITVWVEDDPEGPHGVLLHREAQRVDDKPDEDGVIMPLARGVIRFDLRYLDGQTGEWRDEWDTDGAETPYRLPRAVEIVLVLAAPDPDDPEREEERSFLRTVLVERASALRRSALSGGAQGLDLERGGLPRK